ncbi:MAG: shikimate dehydrogenase [Alphaproteobacteria bacterium]|nr:shikimate dehydrogenase [Alphaproteobacteria bacterium]
MNENFVKTAVIGHPIAHSKSPLIHNTWLGKYELNGSYEAVDIAPDVLGTGVKALVKQGYCGFNVTLPHKIAIIDLCDEIDARAKTIGAVNTVTICDGKLYGTNTDAFGFAHNILETCKDKGWDDWSFAGGRAIVLGAGGASRAVIYALLNQGVPEIVLLNRTREKADELAQMAPDKIIVRSWDERNKIVIDANLIVNTTSLGMEGKPPLDIDISLAPPDALVTDIVYAPLYTGLLQQAKGQNLRHVTGIGMLLHQARPGFELWNGVMPEVTPALIDKVLAA